MEFNSIIEVKKLFDINIFDIIDEFFKRDRFQEEVILLNQDQLLSGVDANDKIIKTVGGSPYRARTVKIKKKKGQPTNIVTLKDTGQFYDTFKVRVIREGYEIIADFRKDEEDIRDNFSDEFDFLGLTDESLAQLVFETILPLLHKELRSKLGL